MYVGEYPPFQDQAARLMGVDLRELLAVGETITGVTSHLRTIYGYDALPASHMPVVPQADGTIVHQLVVLDDPAEFLVGNAYALSFLATTSAGRILGPWARFHVERGFGVTGYPTGGTPAAAQSVILTAGMLFYTLPVTTGGYVGQDLPVASQSEKLAYGFNFSPALSPDEVITSATARLALIDGVDAAVTGSPTAYSISSPVIDGNTVSQMIQWPAGSYLSGNIYALFLTAVTDFNQSLAAWSRIVIDRVA
jgi:hypothetical protein